MESPNLGPDWFWKLAGIFVIIGCVATIYFAIKGILWLFEHIQIV